MSREDQRESTRQWRRAGGAVAVLILAFIAALRYRAAAPTASAAASEAAEAQQSSMPQSPLQSETMPAPSPLPAVKAWVGTEIAGDIHIDAAGHVIADQDLHELFDYLLTASNVLAPEQIRHYLLDIGRRHRLDASQLAELDALFGRYNDYRAAAARLPAPAGDVASFRRSFEARHQLRQDKLGAEMAEGFFAGSEAEDRYQLAQLEVTNDNSISDDERRIELAALRKEAPSEVTAAQQPSQTLQQLAAQTAQLRQSGAGEAQIDALRMQTLGPEAAARMHTLDQENAAWDQRMQALRNTRAQITAEAGIAEADKQRAIDDYIDKNFSGPDAMRARALLSVDQGSTN
jgi:lipase chaperone LimK